jgi:hypothetical protein
MKRHPLFSLLLRFALFITPLLVSVPTQGQAKNRTQLAGGYTFVYSPRTDMLPTSFWNGWDTSVAITPSSRVPEVSAVFSADAEYSSLDSSRSHSLLAGGRWSWSPENRWQSKTIFVQGLLGVRHFSSTGSGFAATSFASDIGGGLDVPITPRVGLRAIQIDYRTNAETLRQHDIRFTTGLTFGFKMLSRN